jgi:hypothetical protein
MSAETTLRRVPAAATMILSIVIACATPLAWAEQDDGAPPAVLSHVPGLTITPLTRLPAAPPTASALGWGVVAEQKFGRYEAVSFAGAFAPMAGGACAIDKGNVALFRGTRLVALVYASPTSEEPIGNLSRVGERLRIFDGGPAPAPVGDIALMPDGAIAVEPVAAEERVCGGSGVVPNVYGKRIDSLRKALLSKGWQPVKGKPLDPGHPQPFVETLRRHGIVEATSCAGTGLAYCSYDYRKGGMALEITSYGDGLYPTAMNYSVKCTPGK